MMDERMWRPHVHRVGKWTDPLSPTVNPYVNRIRAVRWFFYHRFQKALEIAGPWPQARVLEFGCWQGYFLPSLLQNYGDVWAVDNDACSLVEMIPGRSTTLQMARELCEAEMGPTARLKLIKADGQRLPFRDRCFDLIFCIDTLPYLSDNTKRAALTEFRRVLREGGKLIISLPIEMGPILILREIFRVCSGSWRDNYSWRELFSALCFKPSPRARPSQPVNLKGYEYRQDVTLIASYFSLQKERFVPLSFLGRLNPMVLYAWVAS